MQPYHIYTFVSIFFLKTALWIYNSYAIKFTHLKCTIQWFLVCSQSCVTISTINFRTSHHPKRKLHIPLTPSPWQPPIHFLSTHLCLLSPPSSASMAVLRVCEAPAASCRQCSHEWMHHNSPRLPVDGHLARAYVFQQEAVSKL